MIVGDSEVAAGEVQLKPLTREGDQQTVPIGGVANAILDAIEASLIAEITAVDDEGTG